MRLIKRHGFWLVFALSLVILFTPAGGSQPPFYGADKLVHILLFALLTASLRLRGGRWETIFLFLIWYALVSEMIQYTLVEGRSFSAFDLVANGAGILAARLGWAGK